MNDDVIDNLEIEHLTSEVSIEKPNKKNKNKLVEEKVEVTDNKPKLSVTFYNSSNRTIYMGTYFILSGQTKQIPNSVAKSLIEKDFKTKYYLNNKQLVVK